MDRVIVLSCMHGRHRTVKRCLELMPFIDKVMIYSTPKDGRWLESQSVQYIGQFANEPLSTKWNEGLYSLKDLDFKAVILLGSDDYICEKFVSYVVNNIEGNDMIGFTDIYFREKNELYYWKGYTNRRQGEPSGAGRTFSKSYLERINYDLFPEPRNRGLDGLSWRVITRTNANVHITSLKENGLMLCDIKDGEGLSQLNKFETTKIT